MFQLARVARHAPRMTAVAEGAWFTWIGPVNVCPPSLEKL